MLLVSIDVPHHGIRGAHRSTLCPRRTPSWASPHGPPTINDTTARVHMRCAQVFEGPGIRGVEIFRSPGGAAAVVQHPLAPGLADYADAIAIAARRIAAFEGRPPEQLVRDLRHLCPSTEADAARFVGKVVELVGAPNTAGHLEGDVVLQVQADDQFLTARVTLSVEDYVRAGAAHLSQQYVSVLGQRHHGRRTHTIKTATNFADLPI